MNEEYPYFKKHGGKRKYTRDYMERMLVTREFADNLVVKDESIDTGEEEMDESLRIKIRNLLSEDGHNDYPTDYPTREDIQDLESELQDYVGIHIMEDRDVDEYELMEGMLTILENNGIKAYMGWEKIVIPVHNDEVVITLKDNKVRVQ